MPEAVTHPTTQELAAFGLGKLPERNAAAIAAHLESCPACRKVVANVSADSFLAKVRDARPNDSSFPPGLARPAIPQVQIPNVPPELARHPKYLILRELGRGGMGVVYQARHKEMDRQVVIKVINRSLLDRPDTLERFQREVRAAAALSHPNIVTAFDAEQIGDAHMLVMEFVPGQSLAEVVQKRGTLPVEFACHFARQAALGLQHAHERNMVHRDIKPQNLMLSLKNQIKILDFGLAKVMREQNAATGLTSHDAFMGTPDYCAPEQATDARTADIRADLYSLGCTLYYLLSGRPPFYEDTFVKIVLAHQQKQPQPLPELRPEVPAELWHVVARLLAKEPGQRYQNPIEVFRALSVFVKPGAKLEAKSGSMLPPVARSPNKGTVIAADTGEIRKILRNVPGKAPPKPVPAKDEASSFADLTDEGAAPREVVQVRGRGKPSSAARWKSHRVLATAVGVSLALILMAVIIIKVKLQTLNGDSNKVTSPNVGKGKPKPRPDEVIVVLEIDQPGAEVFVDGKEIKVFVPGENDPIEIKVEPGRHKLRIRKSGFVAVTQDIELKTGKSPPIKVRLEPEPPTPPDKPKDEGKAKWVPLFNGKDLDGWKPSPGATWRVNESGALIGSGNTPSGLFTERDDFADFHLRVEAMLGDGFNSRFQFRASGPHYGVMINGEPGPNQFPWPTGTLFRNDSGDKPLELARRVELKRGRWFKLEIIAQGTHIKVLVDDAVVVDYTDTDNSRSRGRIGLTRRPNSVVRLRKIEIKELKSKANLPHERDKLPADAGIDNLREALKNEDLAVREVAAARLADLGDKAEPAMYALAEALTNAKNPIDVRRNAALAIAHIGAKAKPVAPALGQALNSSEPLEVRRYSAEALALMKYPANEAALSAILKTLEQDSDPIVRQKCVWALFALTDVPHLKKTGAAKILTTVLDETAEKMALVRYDAARKLANALYDEAPDKTADVLLEMLTNKTLRVFNRTDVKVVKDRSELQANTGGDARYMAAQALSWLGRKARNRKDVIDALKTAANDTNTRLREAAQQTLKNLGVP